MFATTHGVSPLAAIAGSVLLGTTIGMVQSVMRAVSSLMCAMLMVTEKYDLADNPCAQQLLLQELRHCCVWHEWELLRGERIGTGWGVDVRLRFVASVTVTSGVGSGSNAGDCDDSRPKLVVMVYRWRGLTRPVLSDAELLPTDGVGLLDPADQVLTIRIDSKCRWEVRNTFEIARPPTCRTLAFSDALAERMLRLHQASASDAAAPRGAFLLAGAPGIGKSMAARIMAHRINGPLIFHNPTNHGESIDNLFAAVQFGHRAKAAVVLIDEVDEDVAAMTTAASGAVTLTVAKQRTNVATDFDKKAWCALFDRFQFMPHIVVATTNRSLDWVRSQDAEHFGGALFRSGRFGHLIDCDRLLLDDASIKKNASKKKHAKAFTRMV